MRSVLSCLCTLAVATLLSVAPAAAADQPALKVTYEEAMETQGVRPDYFNPWFTAPPTGGAVTPTSTAFFGGAEACDPTTAVACPSDGTVQLSQVSFGQPFSSQIPYGSVPGSDCGEDEDCSFVGDAMVRARNLLYYHDSDEPGLAAFRYKDLLYGTYDTDDVAIACCGSASCCSVADPPSCCSFPVGETDPVNQIEARLKSMSDFYAQPERDRSVEAERLLRDALKYAPENRVLRNALLDIFYDRAVAELALAKEKLVAVARARIEPPPPGGLVIDSEISSYEALLGDPATPGGYRFALNGYFELWRDPMGVDVAAIDSAVLDQRPFGYYLFQTEVPGRSLYAANYLEGGVPTPLIDNGNGEPDQIFAGFKDLVMIFDVLADAADATVQLARLYLMRSQGEDLVNALDLVSEAQQKLYLEGTILLGAMEDPLPTPGDASGIAEAIAGWRRGLSDLQTTRDFIRGDANFLGFADDFLMIAQTYDSSTSGDPFTASSYDQLVGWMSDPLNPSAPLTWARTKYDEARDSYDSYRGHQGQLETQFNDRTNLYNQRLFDIVGVNRGEPGYDTPEENVGSEIWLQIQSVKVAQTRILSNQVRLANLIEQIQIEVERRGEERGIQNAMSKMYLHYGDRQAAFTVGISAISAAQAAANAAAQAASSWTENPTAGWANAINGVFQAAAEVGKGLLQAKKETLAADERARINDLESLILDVNSEAQIKTWWLEARLIDVDSTEATILLAQEMGRLVALFDEKAEIERRMDRENAQLASRYFADPVHMLRMQTDMIEAEESFQEAQKWSFFAVRALEYKWNAPFVHTHGDRNWGLATVFGLRNAEELQAMIAAMEDWDQSNMSTVRDDHWDWFSVREDFFGYRKLVDGRVHFYEDPETGEMIDAVEAFRRELHRRVDAGPMDSHIAIDFSTVREIPGGSFFLGPQYAPDGQTLLSAGTWLDKIEYLNINLPGSHTLGRDLLTGYLTYGGSSFVRTQDVGVVDPERPDRVDGEMTAWPSRYWYFHQSSDTWRFNEGLTTPVDMELVPNPQVPPSVNQIDVFKERSVAASGWRLVIPTIDNGTEVLDIDELEDIEIYFYHWAAVRPMAKKTDVEE